MKETRSIVTNKIADKVFIVGLLEEGVPKSDSFGENIFVRRFDLLSRKLSKNLIIQILKYIEFSVRTMIYCRDKKIKMINIHSLSLLPLGLVLKLFLRALLVYDTHELETEKNGLVGVRQRLARKLENSLIRFCDQIFVVGESIADWYEYTYKIKRPVVILNSPVFRENHVRKNLFRENLGIGPTKRIFLYQGALTFGRGIEDILGVFKELQDSENVVVFMGYGELADLIKNEAKEYHNIYCYNAVSPDKVLDYTSSADIGLSLIENTCLSYYYCMPNKVFEYIMVGLPVIVSNMIEMKRFIQENEVGLILSDNVRTSLKATILNLRLDDYQNREHFKVVSKIFSWEVQEKKMIGAYHLLTRY